MAEQTASSFSFQISGLLEKMTSNDKDFRFMATNDLMVELQKDSIALDDETEKKIVKSVLSLLSDKNGEVQNLSVRCLAPLTNKIKSTQLDFVVDTLCANMESKDERLRDVSSIALKTVVSELPDFLSTQTIDCIKRIVPKLVEGLQSVSKTDSSVKLEMLEIMNNLIVRYGHSVSLSFDEVEKVLFHQLETERQVLKKRSVVALGYLVGVVATDQYNRIVKKIFDSCTENQNNVSNLRIYVMATIIICRSSSARFCNYLDMFMPLFLRLCKEHEDDELREAYLQSFDTFIFRCTESMDKFNQDVVNVVSELLQFDPNYNYDDDEPANVETEMEADEDADEEAEAQNDDEDEYSDDDDMSWKVRRAAAKCIETMIACRSDKLADSYQTLGPLLIRRFKERESNVKYEVFGAYSALLKLTAQFIPEYFQRPQQNTDNLEMKPFSRSFFMRTLNDELSPEQQKSFRALNEQLPSCMRSLVKEIKCSNVRTQQKCFSLLFCLLRAYPGSLANYVPVIVHSIKRAMADKSLDGNMKIETLRFLSAFLFSHEPQEITPHVELVGSIVLQSIGDPFYKIAAEALNAAHALVRVVRFEDSSTTEIAEPGQMVVSSSTTSSLVLRLYDTAVAKLKVPDVDQEVKEKSIITIGLLCASFAKQLAPKLGECLPLLLDRLRNEMTRLVSIRAFNFIISSPLKTDINVVLPDLLGYLAEFLRKNQRSLRINSLFLLGAIVARFKQGGLQGQGLVQLVKEIPGLISEHDLQISLLAIKFMTEVVATYPNQISESLPALFEALITLSQSSLLQGPALNATLALYTVLMTSSLQNKPTFEKLFERLSSIFHANPQLLHRQCYISVGKAIATILRSLGDQKKASQVTKKLASCLLEVGSGTSGQKGVLTSDSLRLFAILTIGELGRIYHTALDQSTLNPEQLIMESFNSHIEEIKAAASFALGGMATGNMAKFLPFILDTIESDQKKQYPLLHALKEVIASETNNLASFAATPAPSSSVTTASQMAEKINPTFAAAVPRIWTQLLKHCDCPEDGIRNVVAECLGKLCPINPTHFLAELLKCIQDPSSRVRATAVTAVRFMILDRPQPIDEDLRPLMGQFLESVRDPDMYVRRVAIITLNSAAHNKPKLIRDCLVSLLPALYCETDVKQELVYEVEMGPFKHTVDDGLDLRKAAFECMYTLAEQCLDRLDVYEFLGKVENGLKDQHDIRLLTYLMLVRLSYKCPLQLSQKVDRFCEQIKPQLLLKPKANAVKQENEKQEELKRSAIRAAVALKKVPNNERSQKVIELMEIINSNTDLREMLDTMERDQGLTAGGYGFGGGPLPLDPMEVE